MRVKNAQHYGMSLSMDRDNETLLVDGAGLFGIRLGDGAVEAFDVFLRELVKWNRKLNLTAIRGEKEIILKHFLDSLSVLPFVPQDVRLLDIGSGPGFPGIPLKIVASSLDITLVDSVRKKVDFQRHILRTLGLKGIEAVHGRVQDRSFLQGRAGRFDGVVSRAFSDLRTFLALSAPFLKKSGMAVAMKGKAAEEEIRALEDEEKARFELERVSRFNLPFSTLQRSILLFKLVEVDPSGGA
jgi:16S rRNA (guanine527-N7)-methyltransferase